MVRAGAAIGAVVVLGLLGAGCRSEAPATQEYLLAIELPASEPRESEPSASEEAGRAPTLPPLAVRSLAARGFLDRDEIAWREGDVRAGAYRYRRWSELPAECVTRLLVDAIRARGAFQRVEAGDAGDGLVVSGELLGLHEESDEQGAHPKGVAEVELVLELRGAGDRDPAVRRIVRSRAQVAAEGDSMDAVVRAIRTALAEVLSDLARQVEAEAGG